MGLAGQTSINHTVPKYIHMCSSIVSKLLPLAVQVRLRL